MGKLVASLLPPGQSDNQRATTQQPGYGHDNDS